MNRRKHSIFGTVVVVVAVVSSPALAQTFQIDGRAVTLPRRLTLSGSRYSGGGVTLKITKIGTTVRHAKRPTTACELT